MVRPTLRHEAGPIQVSRKLRVRHKITFAVQCGGVEVTESALSEFFGVTLPHLDEPQRRLMVGAAAVMLGHGKDQGREAVGGVLTDGEQGRRRDRSGC